MSYSLFRELIDLAEEFEESSSHPSAISIASFAHWLSSRVKGKKYQTVDEPDWLGKDGGRTPESVISTLILHLNRYARIYSKNAISKSPFTSMDDVIFLINLQHLGTMTKTKLIELNIHEKSTGTQIINRLINNGYVKESSNRRDKRSKEICITYSGSQALEQVMDNVRKATRIVAGDITLEEKLQLIRILQKLEFYHSVNCKQLKQFN